MNSSRLKLCDSLIKLADLCVEASAYSRRETTVDSQNGAANRKVFMRDADIIEQLAGVCIFVARGPFRSIPIAIADMLELALERSATPGILQQGVDFEARQAELLTFAQWFPKDKSELWITIVSTFSSGVSTPNASQIIETLALLRCEFKKVKNAEFVSVFQRFEAGIVADLIELQIAATFRKEDASLTNNSCFRDHLRSVLSMLRGGRTGKSTFVSTMQSLVELRSEIQLIGRVSERDLTFQLLSEFFDLLEMAEPILGRPRVAGKL